MNLLKRNTRALVRGMATASKVEFEECAKELKAITGDLGQPAEVRLCARDLGGLIRKHIRRF